MVVKESQKNVKGHALTVKEEYLGQDDNQWLFDSKIYTLNEGNENLDPNSITDLQIEDLIDICQKVRKEAGDQEFLESDVQ